MTYQDAVAVLPKEDRYRATVYAIESLLKAKGFYTDHEFQGKVIEWTKTRYTGGSFGHSDFICDQVAEYYGVTRASLKAKSNFKEIVVPRQVAMYLIRALTDWSLPAMARYFSKHHATVFYSIDAVKLRRERDSVLDDVLKTISNSFHEEFGTQD